MRKEILVINHDTEVFEHILSLERDYKHYYNIIVGER